MAKTLEKRVAEVIAHETDWTAQVLKSRKSELKRGKTTEKLVEQLQDRIETASEKWFDQFFNGDQELVTTQIDNAVKANLDNMLEEAVKSATVGTGGYGGAPKLFKSKIDPILNEAITESFKALDLPSKIKAAIAAQEEAMQLHINNVVSDYIRRELHNLSRSSEELIKAAIVAHQRNTLETFEARLKGMQELMNAGKG